MPVKKLPATKKQARILRNLNDSSLKIAILQRATELITVLFDDANDGIPGHGIMSKPIPVTVDAATKRHLDSLDGKYLGPSFKAASCLAIDAAIKEKMNGGRR